MPDNKVQSKGSASIPNRVATQASLGLFWLFLFVAAILWAFHSHVELPVKMVACVCAVVVLALAWTIESYAKAKSSHVTGPLVLANGSLVAAALILFVVAVDYHDKYAKAHRNAYSPRDVQAVRASPEPFFRNAQRAASATVLLCVAALVIVYKTRHAISLAGFILCVCVSIYTVLRVGARY